MKNNVHGKHVYNDNKHTVSHKKVKRRLKKKIKISLLVILASVLFIITIISGYKLITWYIDKKRTNEIIDEINKNATVEEIEDNNNTELINEPEEKESDYWYYVKLPLINVDFENLITKNSDTVGWINVNNTNINYPFVQSNDNKYYLTHSYDKSYNKAGWVFLDYRNNEKFTDKNNVIFAHGRYDKTMFGSLSNVLKKDWYDNKDNHIVNLSTPTENSLWQIFSVYTIVEEDYYITTSFANDHDFQTFLEVIEERSTHDFNTTLDTSDKILTLSTCYKDNIRTAVHAKLIKKEVK